MDLNFLLENIPMWAREIIEERIGLPLKEDIDKLAPGKKKYLWKILESVKLKIPISKTLGLKYFYDKPFLNKDVLDPRFDSEIIIDILKQIKKEFSKGQYALS